MAKSDSTEMQHRINTIYAMLIQGLQRKSIIQYCSDKFQISERQVDEYLRQARLMMSDDAHKDLEYKKSEILAQYYDLYNKSYKTEDYKECKSILESLVKIFGLNAVQKTELENNINVNNFNIKDILKFDNSE